MSKRVHTTICWILAVSLVWLPLSVSADISLRSIEKNSCHEMNSTMPGHDMSVHDMPSAVSGKITESDDAMIDNTMSKSMMQKGCCDQCGNDCLACTGMSTCGHSSHHASPFTLSNQYSFQPLYLAQALIKQFIEYHNQIITPDIRPPIV